MIRQNHYEQYWRNKNNILTVRELQMCLLKFDISFLIWSMLHCVHENDPQIDNTEKVQENKKIRPECFMMD